MAKINNDDVSSAQLLLKELYIYYNYDEAVAKARETHSSKYMKDRDEYGDRLFHDLEKVLSGKTEKEIHSLLLKAIAEELS